MNTYTSPSFSSFTFGCRVNEAERIDMDRKMILAGFVKTDKNPDIYIINTCAVTAKAEREARQLILKLKRSNPRLKLVVTGCSATYWEKNGLWRNIPIDLIISNTDKEYAVLLIGKRLYHGKIPIQPQVAAKQPFYDKFLDSGRVMVKIQDGCHRFCTYCIVPYLRGVPRSRTIDEIVQGVREYSQEMREAILTAINTEAFGRDTGERLEDLVQTVLAQTSIARLSFGSIHPWSLTPTFVRLYGNLAEEGRFSRFFHVPIQSGSNTVLRLMKRDYTREALLEQLLSVKKIHEDTFLATDVIAGFLDESDRDFNDTYSFLEQSPFSRLHVFRFSKRQNTAAYYLAKRLSEPTTAEKTKRSQALLRLSKLKYARFLRSQVGKTDIALFIGTPEDGFQTGLLSNQLPVAVAVPNTLSGKMKRVTITNLKSGVLTGTLA